ncbi:MAG TPA: hypothetical protein VFS20_22345 [Longimicrobium sp.]|nr:hypothetical protein [Longimicrobium sp.]
MSRIFSIARRAALVAAALLCAACAGGDGPGPGTGPQPVPGTALVSLAGARVDDRGVLLEVGTGVTDITAGGSATIGAGPVSTDGRRRVLVLGVLQGDLLRLTVSDVKQLPAVQVHEVAASDGSVRTDLSGYSAQVRAQ